LSILAKGIFCVNKGKIKKEKSKKTNKKGVDNEKMW
jgi:hypothetical protein